MAFRHRLAALALIFATQTAEAAEWINLPAAQEADAARDPVTLDLRRDIRLEKRPDRFLVRISADQRFVLYVNGARVAAGPARGDLQHWRYEEVDLAPYLTRGANVVAAKVWSDGRFAPLAQISAGVTAFWLEAANPNHAELIDTGPGWKVRLDRSRRVGAGTPQLIQQLGPTFYAAGGPESIDAALMAADWNKIRTTTSGWVHATPVGEAKPRWTLTVDALPQMRHQRVKSGRLIRAQGISSSTRFPAGPITIAAHSEASLLIDAGQVIAAYPTLVTSGGAGAEIKLTYSEALYDPARRRNGAKGAPLRFEDRARVDDGLALGLTDTFKIDGAKTRRLSPFWWRCWRFVDVKIKTESEPIRIDRLDTYETGYPFTQKGRFESDDKDLNRIFQIGWHTALLNAHETYMDTAYWEQLQYIGDTRLQMLLSYDVAGDPKLAIQALDAFNASRLGEGMPQAAWPQTNKNIIPPFALLWIGALHDYWIRQPDTRVIVRALPGTRAVLDWYAPYVGENGIVQPTPFWPFIDWQPTLDGMARKNHKGPDSCIITLLYYGALKEAAELESALGERARANDYQQKLQRTAGGLKKTCWAEDRGLYADTPERADFSQHVNALAVIYDLVPPADQRKVIDKIMRPDGGIAPPPGIIGTTYYFSYYLARAADHAGLGSRYFDLLKTWRDLLSHNFTSWPEQFEPSRSDTHAWSAHPTSGLLAYIAGIQPDAPGFARIRIAPHLGSLRRLDASLAHPNGLIQTRYRVKADRLKAIVTLPRGTYGIFLWNEKAYPITSGVNRLHLQLK